MSSFFYWKIILVSAWDSLVLQLRNIKLHRSRINYYLKIQTCYIKLILPEKLVFCMKQRGIFLEIWCRKQVFLRQRIHCDACKCIWFRRLSPERGRSEDVERADSLRSFTRQDKGQLQRDWSSTNAEHRMPRGELLQVRSYSSRLDRDSDTSHSSYHHHNETDSARMRHRRGKQQIERHFIMTSRLLSNKSQL